MAIIFDGYDLIVYGTVIPSLLEEPSWNLAAAEAGRIGSWALVGMLIGALPWRLVPLLDLIRERHFVNRVTKLCDEIDNVGVVNAGLAFGGARG